MQQLNILAAAVGHADFHLAPVQIHQNPVGMVFCLAKIDRKGVGLIRASKYSDAGDIVFLDIFALGIDKVGLDIMLVQPGNAGPIHTELWFHNAAYFFGHTAHSQYNVAGQRTGDPIFLVDRLFDIV